MPLNSWEGVERAAVIVYPAVQIFIIIPFCYLETLEFVAAV